MRRLGLHLLATVADPRLPPRDPQVFSKLIELGVERTDDVRLALSLSVALLPTESTLTLVFALATQYESAPTFSKAEGDKKEQEAKSKI